MPDRVEQWARSQLGRPRLGELLGDDPPIIGHADLRIELLSRLEQPDTAVLFLISGGKGSGKSSIVRWLAKTAPDRVVIVHDAEPLGQLTLDPPGERSVDTPE